MEYEGFPATIVNVENQSVPLFVMVFPSIPPIGMKIFLRDGNEIEQYAIVDIGIIAKPHAGYEIDAMDRAELIGVDVMSRGGCVMVQKIYAQPDSNGAPPSPPGP